MAEWFARKRLGGQADFESAGPCAVDGASASKEAREVMRKCFGIDISSHRSRNMRSVSVNDFDYVVAMTRHLASDLKSEYQSINAKLIPWDIPDPYGKDVAVYERCAREIQGKIKELLVCLKQEN
jgi:protein-tyrosine-phosphatase